LAASATAIRARTKNLRHTQRQQIAQHPQPKVRSITSTTTFRSGTLTQKLALYGGLYEHRDRQHDTATRPAAFQFAGGGNGGRAFRRIASTREEPHYDPARFPQTSVRDTLYQRERETALEAVHHH